jgi:MFS family permease
MPGLTLKPRTRSLLVVGCVLAGTFFTYLSFALIAPFYPQRLAEMGISGFLTGFIFACYPLTSFLCALALGPRVKELGHQRELLVGGLMLCGLASLGFAALGAIPLVYPTTATLPPGVNTTTTPPLTVPPLPFFPTAGVSWMFLLLSILFRVMQGVGAATCVVLGTALVAAEVPNNVAMMTALGNMIAGLGYALGPTAGGVFFDLAGWFLPFTVCGAGLVCMSGVYWVAFSLPVQPEDKSAQSSPDTTGKTTAELATEAESKRLDTLPDAPVALMLRFPPVLVCCVAQIFVVTILGFEDPVLGPLLGNPHGPYGGVSQLKIGLMFSVVAGAYMVIAMFAGAVADSIPLLLAPTLLVGLLCVGVGGMLVGPAPFLPLSPSMAWIAAGNAVMGVGCGLAGVPVYSLLLRQGGLYLSSRGQDLNPRNTLSGAVSASFSVGEFTGPLIAQPLVSWLGFRGATTGLGLLLVTWGALCLVVLALFMKRDPARHGAEESAPLLTN